MQPRYFPLHEQVAVWPVRGLPDAGQISSSREQRLARCRMQVSDSAHCQHERATSVLTGSGGGQGVPAPSRRVLSYGARSWGLGVALCLLVAGPVVSVDAATSETLFAPVGLGVVDLFGFASGTAGDVNGDGYDDVIVGAYQNDAGGSNAGRAYVYYGAPVADATADLVFTGGAPADSFGYSVGTAGDVNGDGYADLIVGADGDDTAGTNAGRAYVYYGGPSTDSVADLVLTGEAAGDLFGHCVGTAGDLNGDGYDDVIVGAFRNNAAGLDAGRAYVFYGGPGADAVADLTITGGFFEGLGVSVGTAGDVNGDGYADVVVGAYKSSSQVGRAYVYYGGPTPDATADLVLTGEAMGDSFGWSVGTAGDMNGDGYADIYAGAPRALAGSVPAAGRAYVYYGGASADTTVDLVLTGDEASNNFFGHRGGTAGDVNGDGYSDLIVGAYHWEWNTSVGRAYVYLGGPVPNTIVDLVLTGEVAGDRFGNSVGTAGDVNGDGLADLIIGADGNDAGGTQAGRAYVMSVDFGPTGIGVPPTTAGDLALSGPRPNPLRGSGGAAFDFVLPAPDRVRLTLYNLAGRRLATREAESIASGGSHSAYWDPGALPSGVYYVRLTTNSGRSAVARWVVTR